jgi:hypothetical protein
MTTTICAETKWKWIKRRNGHDVRNLKTARQQTGRERVRASVETATIRSRESLVTPSSGRSRASSSEAFFVAGPVNAIRALRV